MAIRFRRRIKLLPGVTMNVGKTAASVSFGVRGAHTTVGPTGTRTTAGIPGTGLSATHLAGTAESGAQRVAQDEKPRSLLWGAVKLFLVAWIAATVIVMVLHHS